MPSIFCVHCGTELPGEANFCWKCGKSIRGESPVVEEKWETCEIVYGEVRKRNIFVGDIIVFWAKAIGEKGIYNAGKSQEFVGENASESIPRGNDAKTVAVFNTLINRLIADGWEATGDVGHDWWNQRFKRRIR